MRDLKPKLTINTVTQLTCFLMFALLMNRLLFMHLMVITTLLITALIYAKSQHFFKMIKRMKWFFIVMLFIFAFNTPGQHIQGWDYLLSPTYEGLASGTLQVFRMMALLASLSLIMTFNTKQQLISGFYFLLLPLQAAGLEVERFAARLWLTLEYVESAQISRKQDSFLDQLKTFGQSDDMPQNETSITFKIPVFSVLDNLVLCCLMLAAVYLLIKAFA